MQVPENAGPVAPTVVKQPETAHPASGRQPNITSRILANTNFNDAWKYFIVHHQANNFQQI